MNRLLTWFDYIIGARQREQTYIFNTMGRLYINNGYCGDVRDCILATLKEIKKNGNKRNP